MEMFKTITDELPVPVIVVDSDVKIVYANKSARTFVGEESANILRKRWGEILHCVNQGISPEGCGRQAVCKGCGIRQIVASAYREGKGGRHLEEFLMQESKAVRRVRFVIHSVLTSIEGNDHVMLVLDDITDVVEGKGVLPICAVCKRVREADNKWEEIETYLSNRAGIMITHTVCPECVVSHYS